MIVSHVLLLFSDNGIVVQRLRCLSHGPLNFDFRVAIAP